MNDSDRTQVNFRLTPTEMEQLRTLAIHYGSISAVIRVALDDLWDKRMRGQAAVSQSPGDETRDDPPSGAG